MIGSAPPAFELARMDDDTPTNLEKLRNGKVLVADIWTTRCERCPAALSKLDEMAAQHKENGEVVFVSINGDDKDFAQELIEENDWSNLIHCFLDEKNKNIIKEQMGLKSVPFYIILKKDGTIAQFGGPKDIDLTKLPELISGQPQQQSISFDEDF